MKVFYEGIYEGVFSHLYHNTLIQLFHDLSKIKLNPPFCLGDTVILEGVKRDFAGEYFCNADNGVGSSPTVESIQLDVLCKYS